MQEKDGKSSKSKSNKKSRKDYWQKYWQTKGPSILERRKTRYRSDSRYKNEITEARKQSYVRNRNLKYKRPKPVYFEKMKSFPVEYRGRQLMTYGIGDCATCIGRSVSSLRYWERNNIIPKTPLRYQRKCMYTREMIVAIVEALNEQDFPGNVDLVELSNHVNAAWQALDII